MGKIMSAVVPSCFDTPFIYMCRNSAGTRCMCGVVYLEGKSEVLSVFYSFFGNERPAPKEYTLDMKHDNK